MRRRWILVGVALSVAGAALAWFATPRRTIADAANPLGVHNLHLVDADPTTGFAVYRLGYPLAEDMKSLCALGVTEMAVLAGTARRREVAYADQCPGLKVVYDVEQTMEPLTTSFLAGFDAWVASARERGVKIAFRCNCGCHRTGRLAAYYQMKHRGLTAKDAWHLALARGRGMGIIDRLTGMQTQILALEQHIHDEPCTYGEMCVVDDLADAAQESAPECTNALDGCGWVLG